MYVVGGYLITHEQLSTIGEIRGIGKIPTGLTNRLNTYLEGLGIKIFALPVSYPRDTETVEGETWIMIVSKARYDKNLSPTSATPYIQDESDYIVKRWLENNFRILDPKFVTVADPYYDL